MRRVRRRLLIALGVVVFLAISFQLARLLTAENGERAAIFALVRDEARGDARAVAGRLVSCTGACPREIAATVARTRRPGEVKLLRLDAGTSFALGERVGRSRVAWAADVAGGSPAVVQCVTVRRRWSVLSGASISLLRLSAPLPLEQGC